MPEGIEGIIPPMVTPFDEAEELDLKALAEDVEYLIAAGVHGLAVGGSTGEGAGLEPAELYQACKTAVEVARGRVPVYGSAIPDTTREAIRLGLAAKEAGVVGLQVTPPHYLWRPNADGLVEYYGRLAEAVGLPIIVYNVIPWAPITAETMEKIAAAVPLVRSIKQSGGDLHTLADLLLRLGDRITVLSAVDDLLYPAFMLGAHGAIAAIVTVAPAMVVRLFEAVRAGRHAEALDLHHRLLTVWRAVEGSNLPAKVKYALELQGRRAGRPRSPLQPPSEAEREAIKRALAAAGLGRAEPGPWQGQVVARLVLYVDGASSGNPGPAGIGVVAVANGQQVGRWQEPVGRATNNQAEYLALKRALELALELGARQVEVRLDSELVYRQLRGEYRVVDPQLQNLHEAVRRLAGQFEGFDLKWVPRNANAEANRLARQAIRLAARS
ncbi:MAG: hypothetical protein C4315_03555 [Chloroflexota bacterium]